MTSATDDILADDENEKCPRCGSFVTALVATASGTQDNGCDVDVCIYECLICGAEWTD